jgi:hypothetical protein
METIPKKYSVSYNNTRYYINQTLATKQGLSDETIKSIVDKHIDKLKIYEKMESCTEIDKLKQFAYDVRDIEYDLQELWGFEQNENYHRFWEVPKCTCPVLDNIDRIGTSYQVVSGTCIIHGSM